MPKIRIPVEQLPPPNSDGDHVVQFRMISEDRNRISAWSNLYIVKSTGQYRPLESDYTFTSASPTVSVTWDTPSYYNYNSASLTSASVLHNHSLDFKRHDTDIFISWDSQSFEYHDRVNTDTISIIVPPGSSTIRVVGTVAIHGIPRQGTKEEDIDFELRMDEYTNKVFNLFKIFDTGTKTIT